MVWWCLGARGFCWQCAGGARPRCGVGHGGFAAVGGRARCRVHVQHPWPPPLFRGVLPPPPWGVAAPSLGGGGCGPRSCWWGVCWVRPFRRDPSFVGGCGGCGGLFVICIVVASIFVVCARPPFLFCPAFAVGRVGGVWPAGPPCGGRVGVFFVVCGFVGHSVDALAPRADEGRCGLRYAPGSWRASFDPGVSEWGNPARVVLGHHHLNVYRVVGGTRGSETSQYP